MIRTTLTVLFLACAVLLQAGAVQASQESIIKLAAVAEMEIEVVTEDGKTEIERVEAAKVIPGDEVIYTIHYSNVGNEAADNVAITNPIPEHTEFVEYTASGAGTSISYSIDRGVTYDDPMNLVIVDAEGNERLATPAEYTHIRWELESPLPPQRGGYVTFRAVLL